MVEATAATLPYGAAFDASFTSLAQHLTSSTVRITSGRGAVGSGVICGPPGTVVTNAHVARREGLGVDLPDGTTGIGRLLRRDPARDLALLRLEGSTPKGIEIDSEGSLRVGQLVVSIGNPMGLSNAGSIGVVHALSAPSSRVSMVLADIRLAPGFSGGPMAGADGRLVGINTMVSGGLGLAIGSTEVQRFLDEAFRPRLGITAQPVITANKRFRGLLVTGLIERAPASTAGILVGDIITGINGHEVQEPGQLSDLLPRIGGSTATLHLLRGTKPLDVVVILNDAEVTAEAGDRAA